MLKCIEFLDACVVHTSSLDLVSIVQKAFFNFFLLEHFQEPLTMFSQTRIVRTHVQYLIEIIYTCISKEMLDVIYCFLFGFGKIIHLSNPEGECPERDGYDQDIWARQGAMRQEKRTYVRLDRGQSWYRNDSSFLLDDEGESGYRPRMSIANPEDNQFKRFSELEGQEVHNENSFDDVHRGGPFYTDGDDGDQIISEKNMILE